MSIFINVKPLTGGNGGVYDIKAVFLSLACDLKKLLSVGWLGFTIV